MHHPRSDYSIYPHNPRHMHQRKARATINPQQAPNNTPMPARQITKPQRLSQGTSQSPAIFQLLLIICEQIRHRQVLVNKLWHSGSLHYNPKFTPCCCTPTTQAQPPLPRLSTMTKALTTMTKTTVHSTRARSAVKKKNDAAADDLQKIVAAEKKDCEDKKKKRAYEKKVEEEMKKKSDEEKSQASVRR